MNNDFTTTSDSQYKQQIGISEALYDIIPLPSQGMFYPRREDGSYVDKAKVYYLTASDEALLTAPNATNGEDWVMELLRKKVIIEGFDLNNLLIGDRDALLIFLRATMDDMYTFPVPHPNNPSKMVDVTVNLNTLKTKKISKQSINEHGHFEFITPKTNKPIIYRLPTVGIMKNVSLRIKSETMAGYKNAEVNRKMYMAQALTVSIDGKDDVMYVQNTLNGLNLLEYRKYIKEIENSMPSIDTDIQVDVEGVQTFRTKLYYTAEFFSPSI